MLVMRPGVTAPYDLYLHLPGGPGAASGRAGFTALWVNVKLRLRDIAHWQPRKAVRSVSVMDPLWAIRTHENIHIRCESLSCGQIDLPPFWEPFIWLSLSMPSPPSSMLSRSLAKHHRIVRVFVTARATKSPGTQPTTELLVYCTHRVTLMAIESERFKTWKSQLRNCWMVNGSPSRSELEERLKKPWSHNRKHI